MKREYLIFFVSFAVVLIDQISKYFAKGISVPIVIIKNLFYLKYTVNTGAAFGILKGYNTPLIFFSLIVLGSVLFYISKLPDKKYVLVSVGLFAGGLIGNLIDRIAFGNVTDFISFAVWPAFNIADSCITLGVLGLVIWLWNN